jgi:hypothetical protein
VAATAVVTDIIDTSIATSNERVHLMHHPPVRPAILT